MPLLKAEGLLLPWYRLSLSQWLKQTSGPGRLRPEQMHQIHTGDVSFVLVRRNVVLHE